MESKTSPRYCWKEEIKEKLRAEESCMHGRGVENKRDVWLNGAG